MDQTNTYQESIINFFNQKIKMEEGYSIKKSEIYSSYEKFCFDNSYFSVDRQKFWREWKNLCSLNNIKIRTKNIRGYTYIEGISPLNDKKEDLKQ